jgi:hypothetical protein
MTPANRIKLEKVGRELSELSRSRENAQTVMLNILQTVELIHRVMEDLTYRPEVNSEIK